METNTLKILAGDIVTQSTMTKASKLQLLNWLQSEATEVQIKVMLLDGEPFVELDEQAEEIVNARFEQHPLNEADIFLGAWQVYQIIMRQKDYDSEMLRNRTIAGVVLAAIIVSVGYKIYKNFLSKAAKACKGKKGEDKSKCMKVYKGKALTEEIKAMTSLMKECSKTKHPDKCRRKIQNKINEKKKKIQVLK